MLTKPVLTFIMIVILFIILLGSAYTVSHGDRTTYVPLVQRGEVPPDPLPTEPLLLLRQANQLAWVNATGTFRRQLTNEESNLGALVAPDGNTILFRQERANAPTRHLLVDARGGTPREIPVPLVNPRWSPDSRYISYTTQNVMLATYEVSTELTRTVISPSYGAYMWHPRLNYLYYTSRRSGGDAIYRINPDGTHDRLILDTPDTERFLSILPDNRLVVSVRNDARYDVVSLNPDGSGYTLLKALPATAEGVTISPMGTALFYEDGDHVYVETLSGDPIADFSFPCEGPYDTCFAFPSAWNPREPEITFFWTQRDLDGTSGTYTTLYTLATDGSQNMPHPIDSGMTRLLAYSPDGRYLAYEKFTDTALTVVVYDRTTQTTSAMYKTPNGLTELQAWHPMP